VKAPEKDAFEAHLPQDVSIISLHSLHGPSVNPAGQALVSAFLDWKLEET
jgi:prephenate dehydrogenase (NADP+)